MDTPPDVAAIAASINEAQRAIIMQEAQYLCRVDTDELQRLGLVEPYIARSGQYWRLTEAGEDLRRHLEQNNG